MPSRVDRSTPVQADGVVAPEGSTKPDIAESQREKNLSRPDRTGHSVVQFKGPSLTQLAFAATDRGVKTPGPSSGHVELCTRAANIPVMGQIGIQHHWLRTQNKEVGMGEVEGQLPGHGELPPIFRNTKWVDHSSESQKTCRVVPEVDAACVERETEVGKETGLWVPLVNDCQTKTKEILDRCSTKASGENEVRDPRITGAGNSL